MTWLFSIGMHNAAVAMLLALLVWGVTRIWKNPPFAHLMWLLVLVKLVTPPIVNFELWTWESRPFQAGNEPAADQSFGVPLIVNSSHISISPAPEIARSDAELTQVPDQNPGSAAGNDSRQFVPARGAQPPITVAAAWNAIRPGLMRIWLVGAGLVALLAGFRIFRFRRMLAGTLPASQRLQTVTDELATRMGLRRSPDVRVVDSAAAPLVWCLGGRATVIVPPAAARCAGRKSDCDGAGP